MIVVLDHTKTDVERARFLKESEARRVVGANGQRRYGEQGKQRPKRSFAHRPLL
jgi:hypothetical protein